MERRGFLGEEPSFGRKKVLPPDPYLQESRFWDLLLLREANPFFYAGIFLLESFYL